MPTTITFTSAGGIQVQSSITCTTSTGTSISGFGAVWGAVWNDLADCLPVPEGTILEPGCCYCFDGEEYHKSQKYLDDGIMGIHSDTYGFAMGHEGEDEPAKLHLAVAGCVLAHVDERYPVGTPLTCTENGYLTEIKKEDKVEYPEKIVAAYWKPEPAEKWGAAGVEVPVNGRHWVKIK